MTQPQGRQDEETDVMNELEKAQAAATMSFADAMRAIGEQMAAAGWIKPTPVRRAGWYPHKPQRRPAASRVRQVGQQQ